MNLRTIAAGAATAAGIFTLTAAPALAGHDSNPSPKVASYSYGLSAVQPDSVPNSEATGTTRIKALPNGKIQVTVRAEGLAPGLPHAMHLHGFAGEMVDRGCPGPDDAGEDGVLTVVEGQPDYGEIIASLTTTGPTGADSALALDRFPVADRNGSLRYTRTFENEAAYAEAGSVQVVVHGIDFDDNGVYAFNEDDEFAAQSSSLGAAIPLEATVPVLCGGVAN